MGGFTSTLGASLATEGLLLQVGGGSSPASFETVANASDMTMPLKADTVDVTNFGDTWHRRASTLLDMGKITFKIYWIPEEITHRNNSTSVGMRYLLVNRILAYWQFVYPDGFDSADSFPAYVTGFSITGKVGGVMEAAVELSNSGAPSLV